MNTIHVLRDSNGQPFKQGLSLLAFNIVTWVEHSTATQLDDWCEANAGYRPSDEDKLSPSKHAAKVASMLLLHMTGATGTSTETEVAHIERYFGVYQLRQQSC